MSKRQQKAHHTHEVGDAYAEGWEARDRAPTGALRPPNPYRLIVQLANPRKQSEELRESQEREADLWDQGWADRDIEGDET